MEGKMAADQNHGNNIIVMQQPMVAAPQQKRPWSSGLCGCCSDCKSCLCVICCGHCYLCHMSMKMDEGCCMPTFCFGALMALRVKFRTQHRIMGSICGDMCDVYWCGPCVLCQLSREYDAIHSS